ncbi:MAG TPA: NUDIX domain-containing protein [Anaerolineales bacterium]|nr:NUDIX domain-containing protein [Anaerolineales bacterium]
MLHEVVAALIVQSRKILLGQRAASREFYPGVWDVFGGHVEPGEGHEGTLVRELQEELGITATAWRVLETMTVPPSSTPHEASDVLIVHLFLVTDWDGTPENRQLEEHSAIGWFSLEEAVQLRLAHPSYPVLFGRYLSSDLKG